MIDLAQTSEGGWRILLVDDSIVVRSAVRAMLSSVTEVGMVETARSATAAIGKLGEHAAAPFDVVVLDVEMPSMSGIEALPHLLATSPTSRVVMASSLTRQGAAVTMAALAAGACDYVCKPSAGGGDALRCFHDELAAKVAIWAKHARRERAAKRMTASASAASGWASRRAPSINGLPTQPSPSPSPKPNRTGAAATSVPTSPPIHFRATSSAERRPYGNATPLRPFKALAIGSSTGGPQALMQLFGALAAPPNCPVFVTQHMPPAFTAMLAEQIGRLTRGACREALDGERATAGSIYVAPGDRHLVVTGTSSQCPDLQLSNDLPENFCRPAVDPMLRSLAAMYRESLCAVILTGMGQDGLVGCRAVKEQGGQVIVQDEATSVVWGMPGAVARDGIADFILPVPEIAALLRPFLGRPNLGAA